MTVNHHLSNSIWISIFTIIGMFSVTHLVVPLQTMIAPGLEAFAALIFPIHGIRVIAAWMFGWWSVPYLLASNVIVALFYALLSLETPHVVFSFERALSWFLVSIVAIIAITVFRFVGIEIGMKASGIGPNTWRQLLLVGFVSSVFNSLGQSIIFSGQLISIGERNVMLGFLIGDTLGTIVCFAILMFTLRVSRFLRSSN
jgi:hypothetical protein